jgi:UDP-N-acetylmuramoyl-tripeptide--D-alanyl-D-alanine ligase
MTLVGVDSVLDALWELAGFVRTQFIHPVLCITGSVGKTTTKNMIAWILSRSVGQGCVTEGNQNNHIGAPLTLLGTVEGSDRYMVLEIGTSGPGEIRALAQLCRPQIAVVTAVGKAHLEGLGDIAGVLKEKMSLPEALPSSGMAVLPSWDTGISAAAEGLSCGVVTFGYLPGDFVQILEEREGDRVKGTLCVEGEPVSLELPMPGVCNMRNAAAAVAATTLMGVSPWAASQALCELPVTPMRMEVRTGPGGSRILVDAYNANPTSMEAALQSLSGMQAKRRLAMLGGMYELGEGWPELHRDVARKAMELGIEVIGVGDRADAYSVAGGSWFPDHESAARWLLSVAAEGTLVLLKGSRKANMEQVMNHLSKGGV